MRILYLLGIIYIALIVSSCATPPYRPAAVVSTEKTTVTPTCSSHHKDPLSVSLLNISSPDRPYQVLGEARVSKYNIVGIKRQEATIRDIMRNLAASLNGDAVINIKNNDDQTISATVIAYKQVMV
jgi:hypothetical protein